MGKVKFIVLMLCAIDVKGYLNKYCRLCAEHTLCKYPKEGPSGDCNAYDTSALLTDEEIVQITNRINARRNLVASGQLKKFPQAANMKKVSWSTDLAMFAQRWADQCDQSVKPSKEDQCRDLENMQVGQVVATVLGPTPGLNVKSFVDMWFMLQLHYTGSVMYYNRSVDDRTNHFTQLIWADTEYVGCAKVKFYRRNHDTVQRLVCNFAPKGNIQNRPVYAIGYPATQCPNNFESHHELSALCKRRNEVGTDITESSSVSSFLRILNLTNNSTKLDLDLNHFKQVIFNSSKINRQRNQKTRQVYANNSYAAKKRDSYHVQSSASEVEIHKAPSFTPERGHSRMYHGYQSRSEPSHSYPSSQKYTETNFRRYELLTTERYDYRRNFGPHLRSHQCTRKSSGMNCCTTQCSISYCVTNQCTRGQVNPCCQPQTPCKQSNVNLCPCNKHTTTCSPITNQCDSCNENCHSSIPECENCGSTICAKRRDMANFNSKTTLYNYYDLFPNIGVRSGDDMSSQDKNLENVELEKPIQFLNRKTDAEHDLQVKNSQNMNFGRPYDLRGIFSSSERKRRDFEDQMTFKPFWQVDEYNFKRPSELKSLRYTTFSNRRNGKTRKSTMISRLPTETITIKVEDDEHKKHKDHITEKYLSFEELLRLRKLSTQDGFDYDLRRVGDALRGKTTHKETTKATAKPPPTTKAHPTTKAKTTTKAMTTTKAHTTTEVNQRVTLKHTTDDETTVITANTPFIRQKQCTRKLTCTWTAFTNTGGGGGSGGSDGRDHAFGPKTPYGYVDGCTRTSTCTRDFMDRNKMATSTDDNEDGSGSTPEEEDYCEKRSLNIKRRNCHDTTTESFNSIGFQEAHTEMPYTTYKINQESQSTNWDSDITKLSVQKESECLCFKDVGRVRRENILDYQCYNQIPGRDYTCIEKERKNKIKLSGDNSLGDNDSFEWKKFTKLSKCNEPSHSCPCNYTKSFNHNNFILFFLCTTFTIYVH